MAWDFNGFHRQCLSIKRMPLKTNLLLQLALCLYKKNISAQNVASTLLAHYNLTSTNARVVLLKHIYATTVLKMKQIKNVLNAVVN